MAAAAITSLSWAQAADSGDCERQLGYKPRHGQEGKDSLWSATPPALVTRMLQMAGTSARDFVVDLGAGDGRIPIAAARRFGARALGIEYNPDLVKLAQCIVQAEGFGDRVRIVEGDIFKADFSQADVVTMYLPPQTTLCLRHRLLALQPGVRVVSHEFTLGDWRPDETGGIENYPAHLWIVPARIGGSWAFRLRGGAEQFTVELHQEFQRIRGEIAFGKTRRPLAGATLRGDEVRFAYRDERDVAWVFTGRVQGRTMAGESRAKGMAELNLDAARLGEADPAAWAWLQPQCRSFYGG